MKRIGEIRGSSISKEHIINSESRVGIDFFKPRLGKDTKDRAKSLKQ